MKSDAFVANGHDLERLFELNLQMLCIAGVDGYFKRVNPAFEWTLGWPRSELLRQPFLSLVHPEDYEPTRRQLNRLAEGSPTIHFENRFRCRDGSYRWLAWTSTPVQDGDLLYASAVDISERKRAEALFRGLLEAAPDSMIITDGDGTIILINAMTEKVFGYSRHELTGQPVEIVIPRRLHEEHKRHRQVYTRAPRLRPMGAGQEFPALRKDGSEFPAEISLGPVEVEGKIYVICAIRDVTQRQQLQESLRRQEAELLAAKKIQEQLLPKQIPVVPGYEIGAIALPARYTGGDHYDFIPLADGRLGFSISDVTGHGFPSALLASALHAYVHSYLETAVSVEAFMERLNETLFRETETHRFATMIHGRLDPETGRFDYSNAGHPSGLVLSADGEVKGHLASTGLPLGIFADTAYGRGAPIMLGPGETLVLLTDGLLETGSPDGIMYDETKFGRLLQQHYHLSIPSILGRVLEDLSDHAEHEALTDDVTIVMVRRRVEDRED